MKYQLWPGWSWSVECHCTVCIRNKIISWFSSPTYWGNGLQWCRFSLAEMHFTKILCILAPFLRQFSWRYYNRNCAFYTQSSILVWLPDLTHQFNVFLGNQVIKRDEASPRFSQTESIVFWHLQVYLPKICEDSFFYIQCFFYSVTQFYFIRAFDLSLSLSLSFSLFLCFFPSLSFASQALFKTNILTVLLRLRYNWALVDCLMCTQPS